VLSMPRHDNIRFMPDMTTQGWHELIKMQRERGMHNPS
jgi:hypothetical protein